MNIDRRQFLALAPAALSAAQTPAAQPAVIKQVDIIHHSHTDVGYTDLPSVTRDMQKRYLDAALDRCLADKSFRWTAEAILTVEDWWRASSPARRQQLISMIKAGRMDVMALPFNQTPFHNAEQWRQMVNWLPESLWRDFQVRAAMQNDVNGFPRAGAIHLLDKGIRHLLMGINADSGGPPFRRPSAFWWRMPDGRRMFVWLGDHYGTAYSYFEAQNWIRGGRGSVTELGPPRPGDVLKTTEQALQISHRHFLERLAKLEKDGYDHPRLILLYTNQWRYDNDPPFTALSDFIDAWNKLGLKPSLRFTTATDAVQSFERDYGAGIPEREGEWTDWWANGDASGPRELAASRIAKRKLAAAMSPAWGPMPASAQPAIEQILKDLCLFDEHTWGADTSVSQPDAIETIGQYTEKSIQAHRPRGAAEWLLSRRARTKLDPLPEGLYAVNASPEANECWVRFSERALRGDFVSIEDPATNLRSPLIKEKGGDVRFWLSPLDAAAVRTWRLSVNPAPPEREGPAPTITTDAKGWPVTASWKGMSNPLFSAEMADFISTQVIPPANRQTIARMHSTADNAKREEMRKQAFQRVTGEYGATATDHNPRTLVFTQPFTHPRLRSATRRIELWRTQPRARVNVKFHRVASPEPEVFYVAFGFPVQGVLPVFSGGGVPFTPYTDQLEGSCRDYYAIDGWAHYTTPFGDWLWVTRDAALVAVGGPHTVARRTTVPADKHRMLAMIFDNFWHTNFVADSHGEMEFQFEIVWNQKIEKPEELAETLASDPVVLINSATRESPELLNNLFRP